MAKPIVSNVFDKLEIHGTDMNKSMPMMLRKIGADQLAPKYGGNNSDWKPVLFHNNGCHHAINMNAEGSL